MQPSESDLLMFEFWTRQIAEAEYLRVRAERAIANLSIKMSGELQLPLWEE